MEQVIQAVSERKPQIKDPNQITASFLDSLFDKIYINNKNLHKCSDPTVMTNRMDVLTVTVSVADAKPMLQDVIGIISLLAITCNGLIGLFTREDAGKSWQKLLQDSESELLVKKVQIIYSRTADIYQQIFGVLCQLVEPKLQFCVKCATTIFTAHIWPNKHSIARWIARN